MGTSWNTEAIKLYAYQLGKRIAKQRLFQVIGDYTHYLFNGKKVRKLPEWNTDKFPYVCLSGDSSFLVMYCFSEPHHNIIERDDGDFFVGAEAGDTYLTSVMFGDVTNNQLPTPEETTATTRTIFFSAYIYDSDTIRWANYDILDKDGNVVLAASEPVPVIESVGYYLFNGVKLKQLPELNEDFSYLIIRNAGLGIYQLRCSNVPWTHRTSQTCTNSGGQYISCASNNGSEWSPMSEPTSSTVTTDVIWTNTDIYSSNGTLWMEASEPVPDYE